MNLGFVKESESEWPSDLGKAMRDVPAQHLQSILDGTAQLLKSAHTDALPEIICEFFCNALAGAVEIQHISVYDFHRGRQPKALFFQGTGYDSNLKLYLRGMYLLDPFFDLFENQKRTGIFHFSTTSRDNLTAPEFVEHYWQLIELNNEVGGLYEISPDRCVHLAFQFSTEDETRISWAISLAKASQSILTAAFQINQTEISVQNDGENQQRLAVHIAVNDTLRDFGKGILTKRERALAQLMLKGHSTKSMAQILKITPGTTSIHRSNIYRKMQVTSLGELFGIFLDNLRS